MPYLIDGHNLIPRLPGLSLQQIDDEQRLIILLQEFCRAARKNAEVYFDNAPAGESRTQRYGTVTAHFIRQGSSADAALAARLKRLGKQAANWTVVSSDLQVQKAARAAQAQVLTSSQFASLILGALSESQTAKPGSELVPLEETEVEEWIRLFGEAKGENSDNINPVS